MSESSQTLVQTAEDEATALPPAEQAFLQAYAQEVLQCDLVEAVLSRKQYGQLYVRTVIRSEDIDAMRAVIHVWNVALRNYNMLRVPSPDHLTVRPPRTAQDVAAAGFRIFAQQ